MKPLFSIITPIYKAEKYLYNCVDSILSQTYGNFELLLVDDGSPDNSGIICDEYAKKDSRVRVFHKENGGVSSARNLGLQHMCGDWVIFVDSDDMLYANALEILSQTINNKETDLIQFSFNREWIANARENFDMAIIPLIEYIRQPICKVCACGSCIRSSIINEFNIRFDSNVKLGEDQLFMFDVFDKIAIITRLPDVLYYYRPNALSATNNTHARDLIISIEAFHEYKKTNENLSALIDRMILYFISELSLKDGVSISYISDVYKKCSISKCYSRALKSQLFYYLSKISVPLAVILLRMMYFIQYKIL